jgi:hypothetical protein
MSDPVKVKALLVSSLTPLSVVKVAVGTSLIAATVKLIVTGAESTVPSLTL